MSKTNEIKNRLARGIKWHGAAIDHEAMSREAAELIIEEIRRQPDLLLCAASGSTPTRCYEWLGAKRQDEPRLFERLRVLKLD